MLKQRIISFVTAVAILVSGISFNMFAAASDPQSELSLGLTNRQSVSNAPNEKWILENVSGTEYKIRNKATDLYLTDKNGTAVQMSATGDSTQVWNFADHYGVSHWKVSNKGTGNYLTVFGEIKLGAEDGNGTGMVCLSAGDLTDPLEVSELAAGEYYIYNEYGSRPDGSFPEINCVLTGNLGLGLSSRQAVSNAANEKWVLENVSGNAYKIKNKATNLYLTDVNGTAIQASKNGDDTQVWNFADHYGVSHWKVSNKGTGNYLTVFGEIKLGAEDGNGTGMVCLSAGDLTDPLEVSELAAGEYYIYNEYGSRPDGSFPNISCVLTGNVPVETKSLDLVSRSEVTGSDNEKWLLENVSGNDYKVKNKATNLYLTEKDGTAIQMAETGSNTQVWNFSDNWGYLWKMQNKATGNYLTSYGIVKTLTADEFSAQGVQLMSLAVSDLNTPITQSELKPGEYYLYNHHGTTASGDTPNEKCVIISEKVAETKPLDLVPRSEITGTDNEKWLLENVSGNDYKVKNKATNLYLTEKDGTAIQMAETGSNTQVWNFSDNWGYLWKMQNKATGNYLTSYGIVKTLTADEFSAQGVQLMSLAVSDLNTPITQSELKSGEYYLYNHHGTTASGDTPNEKCVIISKTDTPVDPPIPTEEGKLTLLARGEASGADAEKWLLENVSGNDYKIKNKLTGLYLTEKDNTAVQMSDIDSETQIWTISDHYGYLWKIQNKSTKNYLTTFQTVTMVSESSYEGNGGQLTTLAKEIGTPITIDQLAEGEFYIYNHHFTGADGSNANAPCVLAAEVPKTQELDVISRSEINNSDNQKWILTQVSGNDYTIKNKATGLFLTDNNGIAVQMSENGENNQVWNFADHYGVSHWKVQNKATSNYLTCFGSVTLVAPASYGYNGTDMICLSAGDLTDPLEVSELAAGEYYVYNEYGSRPDGSFPNIKCVIIGTEDDTLPDDSGLDGDPNEKITLDADKVYEMNVADYTTANGAARQKWIFEAVSGESNRYRIKNKATGFYITQVNDAIVQQAYNESNGQQWELEDEYGLKYTLINIQTGEALRLDMGSFPLPGDVDHSAECLVAFQRYASGILPKDERASETPIAGQDYYIYNWQFKVVVDGVKKGGILVATDVETDPGEVIPDEPMPDQDVANPPIEADEAVNVKLVPMSSAAKTGSQIWIFKEVSIDPFPSFLETLGVELGSDLPAYPEKLTVGYTIQNKETGLYLTDMGGTLVQMQKNDSPEQIWTVENYPYAIDTKYLKIVRNYGTNNQLEFANGVTPGLYSPENYNGETDTQWPELNKKYGGPLAGISTLAFARVPSDMVVNNIFPEDGKGYYIYCGGHGRGASLLEAEGGKVEDQTTDIPSADTWKDQQKDFTYNIDFEQEWDSQNEDWDLLFGGEIYDSYLGGQPIGETESYGIGFRHGTSGMGINRMKFDLLIPEASVGKVAVALRLNDYMDVEDEQTGLRLYLDKDGKIGLKYVGDSNSVTYRATGLNFYEYRAVYIEDDTDTNTIKVYFDNDNQVKTLVATVTIADGVVTLNPAVPGQDGNPQTAITREYGYNIYRDGYISLATLQAYDTQIDNLSITVPCYSTVAFAEDEKPDDNKPDDNNKDDDKIADTSASANITVVMTILVLSIGVLSLSHYTEKKRRFLIRRK